MDKLIQRCAGLDVHRRPSWPASACPAPRAAPAGNPHLLDNDRRPVGAAGLAVHHQVAVVGMESTGAYWKPVYHLLEDELECWLLNARHLRNVPAASPTSAMRPGSASSWSMALSARALCHPTDPPAARPHPLPQGRHQERTREAQRLEKVLEDAGIKRSCVASDILGSPAERCCRP